MELQVQFMQNKNIKKYCFGNKKRLQKVRIKKRRLNFAVV